MYSSNYANEDTTSFLFSDTNINSTYSIEDFSSSSNLLFNYFPSPHINYDDSLAVFDQHLHDIVIHQNNDDQEMVATHQNSNGNMHRITNADEFSCQNSNVKKSSSVDNSNCRQQINVNRRCKKDRHSKIITANGSSRGRRMRLSIDVAKEFFALQDMLKFDKASKTVEWLLIKSKTAINEEVTKNGIIGTRHGSSPSTSILSVVDELESKVMMKENMNGVKGARKLATFYPLTRELRDKARERARERTQEKKRLQLCDYNINDQSKIYNSSQELTFRSHNHLLCWEKSASPACSNILKTNTSTHPTVLEMQELLHYSKQQSPQNIEGTYFGEQLIIDDSSFFMTNNWNPNTMNNHHRNPGTTSTVNEFTQFQYDGKPWKEYNST